MMATSSDEIKLDFRRWIVLALVVVIGSSVAMLSVYFGTISEIIAEHFDVQTQDLDWLFIANSGTSLIVCIPIGITALVYPLEQKKWILAALACIFCCYVLICLSMLSKRLYIFLYIAQIAIGLVFPIYELLLISTSVSWFPEREQATAVGIGCSSMGLGNLFAATQPSILVTLLQNSSLSYLIQVLLYMNAGISIFVLIVLGTTWRYIPNLPRSPPSKVENIRRMTSVKNPELRIMSIVKLNVNELKELICNCKSQILLWTSSLSVALLTINFIMIPVLPGTTGAPSKDALHITAKKAGLLSILAGCGIVAAVVSGLSLDKIKAYKPLAYFLAFSHAFAATLMVLSYHMNWEVILYISVGLHGASHFSVVSFSVEMLKQTVYPKVSEGNQALVASAFATAEIVSLVPIFRLCVSFGNTLFYVAMLVCCCIQALLLVSINPQLRRFQTEDYHEIPQENDVS